MAKTITFTVPAPSVSETTPVEVVLYESDSLSGAKTQVDTVTLASLGYTGSPPEELDWIVAAIDGTKYYWLYLVAVGVQSAPIVLLPEAPAGTVDIVVWTEDAIGVAQSGITFRALPARRGGGAASPKTIVKKAEAITDVAGYAALSLYADTGIYDIQLAGYSEIQVDTTGQSGNAINYADEL